MTKKQQERILGILDEYNTWIGVDKEDIEELKQQVRIIKTMDKDASVEERVVDEVKYWATVLEYSLDKETNANRNQILVAKRDVITFKVAEKFSFYAPLEYVLAETFDKDRSTMLAAIRRCKERLEMNDPLFMSQLNTTLKIAA